MAAETAYRFVEPAMTVNSVDLVDEIEECTLELNYEDLDLTAFGAGGAYDGKPGGGRHRLQLRLHQDFTAGLTDATLSALRPIGTVTGRFPWTIKPGTAAMSPTNPDWSGTAGLVGYQPFAGTPGGKSTVNLNLPVYGEPARATA